MTEAFFFQRRGGLTLREIGALTGAIPPKDTELDRRVSGIAALDRAALRLDAEGALDAHYEQAFRLLRSPAGA